MTEQPCGCERGRFLCPEAETLQKESDAAYERWRTTRSEEDWAVYLRAKEKYDEHFWDQNEELT